MKAESLESSMGKEMRKLTIGIAVGAACQNEKHRNSKSRVRLQLRVARLKTK